MTVALQFTTLYGAEGGAISCLLQIGSVNILLDCGWDSRFDRQLLQPLLTIAPKLDLVLLSQPDLNHLGALPVLARKEAGLTAPVYAAAPVKKLGHIFFHDCLTSQWAVSDFTTFDADDIDSAFKCIRPLKHHQLLELELQGLRLRLVGYPAGHMIGGTVWSIESGGEVLVYGPDTNHMKERHLRGGQLSNVPVRPALLVSGPGSSSGRSRGGALLRAARDQKLLDALRDVFSRGGNVLLPVDSSARMLELLLVLDHFWHTHKFVYHLGLLSYVADSAVRAAAGCLEWMSDELQKEFNSSSINPLACRHVKRCHNVGDVARLGPSSKVVVATGLSLEEGLSRELLVTWGADARNAVIFTQPPPAGSLGDQLLRAGAARPIMLQLALGHREPLTGLELEEYEAQRAEEEAAAAADAEDNAAAATGAAAAAVAAGDLGAAAGLLPIRESSEAIRQLRRNATGALEQVLSDNNAAAGFDEAVLVDEGILMEGFGPPPGATYCMFPDEQELLVQEWDQFGAVMDTTALRVEEAEMEGPGGVADEEDMDLEEQGPTKVVVEQVKLPLSASVALTEGFAGLSDPDSLATIVGGIVPRCLLLLGGSASDLSQLAGLCASKLGQQVQTQIIQPVSGQDVRLRLASSYRLCISQALLDSLSRHKLGIYDVAWLDGVLAAAAAPPAAADDDAAAAAADGGGMLAAAAGSGGPQQQQQQQGEQQQQQQKEKHQRRVHWSEEEQLLTVVPPEAGLDGAGDDAVGSASMDIDAAASVVSAAALTAAADAVAAAVDAQAAAAGANGLPDGSSVQQQAAAAAAAEAAAGRVGDHGGIFIGDVQLSAVKAALATAGIAADFRAGRLVVRGCGLVVSREGGDGGLQLEGSLSDYYFKVRDIVYGLYNIC